MIFSSFLKEKRKSKTFVIMRCFQNFFSQFAAAADEIVSQACLEAFTSSAQIHNFKKLCTTFINKATVILSQKLLMLKVVPWSLAVLLEVHLQRMNICCESKLFHQVLLLRCFFHLPLHFQWVYEQVKMNQSVV